jgi:exonuclease III
MAFVDFAVECAKNRRKRRRKKKKKKQRRFYTAVQRNFRSGSNKPGGGVGLYMSDDLVYKKRNDLFVVDPTVYEGIFIELELKSMIIGCIYRPPNSDLGSFTASIDTTLSKINSDRKLCYIAGDFNIDLLKYDSHVPTADYVNCLFSHSFLPTVNRPTRIDERSATLIDNIITNASQSNCSTDILYSDLSDHLPIILQTNLAVTPMAKPRFSYRRLFTEDAKNKCLHCLQTTDWEVLTNAMMNPDAMYDSFIESFLAIYEECFPLSKVNITRKKMPRKPWMTHGLVRSCNKKEKLYKSFIKNSTSYNKYKYITYRNKLNKVLRIAEKNTMLKDLRM